MFLSSFLKCTPTRIYPQLILPITHISVIYSIFVFYVMLLIINTIFDIKRLQVIATSKNALFIVYRFTKIAF